MRSRLDEHNQQSLAQMYIKRQYEKELEDEAHMEEGSYAELD